MRGYERSLEPVPEELTSRSTSKSSASRALIDDETTEKLTVFLDRLLFVIDGDWTSPSVATEP
jgi:hypothetical protein